MYINQCYFNSCLNAMISHWINMCCKYNSWNQSHFAALMLIWCWMQHMYPSHTACNNNNIFQMQTWLWMLESTILENLFNFAWYSTTIGLMLQRTIKNTTKLFMSSIIWNNNFCRYAVIWFTITKSNYNRNCVVNLYFIRFYLFLDKTQHIHC